MKRNGHRISLCAAALLALGGLFVIGIISLLVAFVILVLIAPVAWRYVRSGKPVLIENIMLLIVSVGSCGVFADLVSRNFYQERLYYRPHEMLIERWPYLPLVSRYKPNAQVIRQTFGDLAAMTTDPSLRQPRNIVFVTDPYGFRNKPSRSGKAAYDVLLIGDSFAVGTGTTQDHTWASLLESEYHLHVYNLAIPGSPWQSYINLAMEMPRLDEANPIIVLALFPGNDLDEAYGPSFDTADLRVASFVGVQSVKLSNYRKRSVIAQLSKRLIQGDESHKVLVRELGDGKKILFYGPYNKRAGRSEQALLGHENYPNLLLTLEAIKELSDRHKATFKVLLIPSKEEIYRWVIDNTAPESTATQPSAFSRIVERFCQSRAIEFLDLTPTMTIAANDLYLNSNRLLWWHDDTHWNSEGHRFVAKTVYERLLKPAPGPEDGLGGRTDGN